MESNAIISRFDGWCEKNPNLTAVVCENVSISYKEFRKKTKNIEVILKKFGIEPGDIVCVLTHRNILSLEIIFGLLRIGAIYMPIDISFPDERVNYILNDSKCKFIITDEKLSSVFQNRIDLQILYVDTIESECKKIIANHNKSCFTQNVSNSDNNRAYILYTSGSTGYPKGVVVGIDSLLNFMDGISDRIGFNVGEKILALTTFSFDISILETVFPLTKGMTIVLAPEDIVRNVRKLAKYICLNHVDVLQMTPTRIRLLLLGNKSKDWIINVSKLLIGGEVFPYELLRELKSHENLRVFNLYGPTETTIWASVAELTSSAYVSIGKPLKGTRFLILDNKGFEVNRGCTGEIYIEGNQLAEGYVNNKELTDEKFVYKNSVRYYRTGDFAKENEDGEYEFIGRSDDIVKIRGYLVSTNEVERVLMSYSKIERAIVFTKRDNFSEFLCVVYKENEIIDISDLEEYVAARLPTYMIPREYYKVDVFPETLNNKIDKKTVINCLKICSKN